MKLFTMVSALAAIFMACAYAAAVPDFSTATVFKRATEPTLDHKVMSSLSSWFGWNLAGAAKSMDDLSEGCQDLNSTGGKKWAEAGLVVANIREPLCNASHSDPNPQTAFPNSIPAISAIIQRQLVGSFNDTKAFSYLCNNLAFFQINQFYLTDTTLLGAVCKKANKQVPPRPFGPGAGRHISEAAGFAARNTASILYGTLVAAGAVSGPELNTFCAHAPEHIDNFNAEMLNGTLVATTICGFQAPLTKEQVQSRILSWTSRLFVTVLENIGRRGGWLDWLCEHLDEEGMNGVGLIGWGAKEQVCRDARTGLPTEPVMPRGIPHKAVERS